MPAIQPIAEQRPSTTQDNTVKVGPLAKLHDLSQSVTGRMTFVDRFADREYNMQSESPSLHSLQVSVLLETRVSMISISLCEYSLTVQFA